MSKRDLVVIGGGTGGLIVTSVAAQLGLKVTLIEQHEKLGGDCLHTGCVPSKTLIHAAKVASMMRRANEYGLKSVEPEIDLAQISDHVQSVIEQIQPHDDPERFRSYGAEVIFGHASFTDPHTIEVNGQAIHGRRFVIASGSSPFIPPVDGLDKVSFLTNESIFSLRQLPKRLIVLGGGAIGVEMAQAFARLGSAVTIIERLPHLLPLEDSDISDQLEHYPHHCHEDGDAQEAVGNDGVYSVRQDSTSYRRPLHHLLDQAGDETVPAAGNDRIRVLAVDAAQVRDALVGRLQKLGAVAGGGHPLTDICVLLQELYRQPAGWVVVDTDSLRLDEVVELGDLRLYLAAIVHQGLPLAGVGHVMGCHWSDFFLGGPITLCLCLRLPFLLAGIWPLE